MTVSAGYDAAAGDELGKMKVSPAGYAHMTHLLSALCGGKLVLALEVSLSQLICGAMKNPLQLFHDLRVDTTSTRSSNLRTLVLKSSSETNLLIYLLSARLLSARPTPSTTSCERRALTGSRWELP